MILGLGSLAVDDLLGVARFPVAGEKMRVAWRRRESGGLAATALAAAVKLGAEAAWLGTLGGDELSAWARTGLERDCVGTQWVRYQEGARPHASVILVEENSGQRTVLSSNDGVPPFPCEAISSEMLYGVDAVLVDHTQIEAACRLAMLARERGLPVVADIERAAHGLEKLLPLIDHFICGLEFGQRLTGEREDVAVLEALRRKFRTGAACCAVTMGERGYWYRVGDTVRHLPAYTVTAVDTTGCGDVFHGAYLGEIARGNGVQAALRFASVAAALAATRIGGRAGLPVRDEVERLMKNDEAG